MKKNKNKFVLSLSVLIVGFLMSSSLLNIISTQALVDTSKNQYISDSFDRSTWLWNITEVVSTESTGDSYSVSLAVDAAGNAHIAWVDPTAYAGSGTDADIFYKRWDASSSSWTTTEVVSTESTGDSYYPSLAVDAAGNVHVAWWDLTEYAGSGTDFDIFYKRWNSSSSSWTTTEVVSTESTGLSYLPSLVVDAIGNVHIAWRDNTDYTGAGTDSDIFYKRWDASSSSWTTTEVVSTESTGTSNLPSIVVDTAGNVHIAWADQTDYAGSGTDRDIFYKRWDTFTSSWTITEVVSTESTGSSFGQSFAFDAAGNVHIAWDDITDYSGAGTDSDIFYKQWEASIATWTTTEVVSTASVGDSTYPSLAIDTAGNIHIAWEIVDVAGTLSEHQISYKRWDASSQIWTTSELVSTESAAFSGSPSLAVDSTGSVHVVWEDETEYAGSGTDRDIFYKIFAGSPAAPELSFIVPNPNEIAISYLDWNNVIGASNYHVYRSTSYIWSVEELQPIATVSSSDYMDNLPAEGYYYYVIVAGNFAGNSTISNCQYVEVKFPDLDAPELATLLPNPTELSSISLLWDSIDGATEYYVYRSASYIWSVEGLTPIDTVATTSYIDSLPSEGFYFYAIVANDGLRNSTHSNCEYIHYKLPTLQEFTIVSSLILGAFVVLFVVMRIRKKKPKPN